MDRCQQQMVYGKLELRSPWFNSRWELRQDDQRLARLQRLGRLYVSRVELPDGCRWMLEPHGTGVVRAVNSDGTEIARVERLSWLGRRWNLVSQAFNYELDSHPRPRAWAITIGGATIAEIRGSLVSYNKVRVNALLGVPLAAVLLAWHVIARPWEAAAEPRGLVPAARPTVVSDSASTPRTES